MKVGFGCDHASVGLKHILMEHVRNKGYECVDYGTTDPKVPVDYPEFGLKVAEAIKSKEVEKGILICGSGIGISLAANKVPGIRAAACSEPCTAKLAVEHSDINIVSMGVCIVGPEIAKAIVDAFFDAQFEGGSYTKRVNMIGDIEKKYSK
ncbi:MULTISPECIES: ribose 5-phosphate isomerase B [Treponema]|jgi:ribose-5-phosphate isomerase B|uniref:Ribose 5-phosphate isomerase B n=1 Tax=Treponema vincentii TaxID=69710 RepID=A0A6P1XZ42_9SPIR|nr:MULTISPECIES: ribose 5-phosphate isomerase B [Treponema]AIW89964.1 ribose 5-phosphate isomerase [Treponema sp. OMZ 838]QHX42701.1 ribose 5-phosphate isomerase B [Treponema vincentii]UTC43360.1 ribose 5-phosphate isomerase B [Treponema sp. OMZ 857]UTC50054.1 ribose 5-phosphate isomerase B [Treponema sp. OMZ 855]UTC56224.1 ribose 5-phosphate isomerase B [Treponema sp. OMZ 906]